MARVLLYGLSLHADGLALVDAESNRYRALIELLGADGHALEIVGGVEDALVVAEDRRRVDQDTERAWWTLAPEQIGDTTVLDHVVGQASPDVLVFVGLEATRALAGLPGNVPTWIDLPKGVAPRKVRGGRGAFYGDLGAVLARSDRVSCANAGDADALRVLLGLLGRLADEVRLEPVVVVAPEAATGDDAWSALRSWVRDPRLGPGARPLAGSREAAMQSQIDDLTNQLAVVTQARVWRLRGVALRWRQRLGRWWVAVMRRLGWLVSTPIRFLRRGQVWITGVLVATVVWLGLLPGTAATFMAAAWRRFRRGDLTPADIDPALPEPEADAGTRLPRLLIVCPYPIHPPNHGGGVRLFNLVKHLGRQCDLYLLVLIRAEDDPKQRAALEPYCRAVAFHHWHPRFERPASSLLPPSVQLFRDPRLAERIRDLVARYDVDVLQLEYTEMAQYGGVVTPITKVLGAEVRTLLVEHDVAFRSLRRRRQLSFRRRYPVNKLYGATFRDWMRLVRFEVRACREADEVHTMSPDDGEYLARFLPGGIARMRVVPNAVDTEAYRPPDGSDGTTIPERRGVLLVGNFQNLPNVDAFDYFTAEVWPLIRALRPDATLTVVGAEMPERILTAGGQDGIEVVGAVPKLEPYYHGHRVLAVPIRAGSGTRLKLFEAFAAGIPSVSTTIGAEGIAYRAGEHLLIGDDPASMASGIEQLLADGALATSVAQAARALAVERYDWALAARANLVGVAALAAERITGDVERVEGWPRAPVVGLDEGPRVEVSIVVPTRNGGALLERALEAMASQVEAPVFEVICVDSGSNTEDVAMMGRLGARVVPIDPRRFNHGLTRDLGAEHARGEILVFVNQDAVPSDDRWLARLVAPLLVPDPPAAVQGGILEVPHDTDPAAWGGVQRFFWDSCGARFYFTRESRRWIARYDGVGFSTVNAALRRAVWNEHRFGFATIMEDKKWQRSVTEAGEAIVTVSDAAVFHTHDYDLRSLSRRCQSEGYGWRMLGETYRVWDLVRDWVQPRVVAELGRGLIRGPARKPAAVLFPWLRPWMLFKGNRLNRSVKL